MLCPQIGVNLQGAGAVCGWAGEVAEESGQCLRAVAEEAEPSVAFGAEQAPNLSGVVVVIDDQRFVGSGAAGTRAALAGEETFVVGRAEPVAVREVAMPLVFGAVARARRRFVAVVGMTDAIGAHT
jgi:hypothetical protein